MEPFFGVYACRARIFRPSAGYSFKTSQPAVAIGLDSLQEQDAFLRLDAPVHHPKTFGKKETDYLRNRFSSPGRPGQVLLDFRKGPARKLSSPGFGSRPSMFRRKQWMKTRE